MKKIVTIGGGTGSFTILSALKDLENCDISALVAMTDDGGSTGVLVDELGVLPAGDVRQCLAALSDDTLIMRRLLSYRFEEGGLKGHSFGNIFLAALEKVSGDFVSAVTEASQILRIKGAVVPVLEGKSELRIQLKDKTILAGENIINHSNLENVGVEKLYLAGENTQLSSSALSAIKNVDYIFIGPGNHFCSILPALSPLGMQEAFKETSAQVIYISNLTNKKGHTSSYSLHEYVSDIEASIARNIDTIIFNTTTPTKEQLDLYRISEGDTVIVKNATEDDRILSEDIIAESIVLFHKNDSIAHTRSFIRHDVQKLKKVFREILKNTPPAI